MQLMELLEAHWREALMTTGLAALCLGYWVRSLFGRLALAKADERARKLLGEAKIQADSLLKEARVEAKEEAFKIRAEVDRDLLERRQDITALEKRIHQKEETLEKRIEIADRKDHDLRNREKALKSREEDLLGKDKDLSSLLESQRLHLQNLAGLTREEARKQLLARIEEEVKSDAAMCLRKMEDGIRDESRRRAQWLLTEAMQRCLVDHVQEATVTAVSLPNDDIKGKIIGRDGRNIRAFESATGVDLIIDDTPETVVISGFDMVRREVARISLENLIKDGRIHPARIEEVVERVKKDLDETIRHAGEKAVFDLGLTPVHPDLIHLIGRLKYRTSYGQNVLEHSKEVAWLLGCIAAELGLDVKTAKRIGLLHDIGKALSHEVEGNHAAIGADLARKYNETGDVVDGIGGHHEEGEHQTMWGVLTLIADAISAGRPGARSDTVENYIQRLEKLEDIACSFQGVEKAFAVQAGREIRVMVDPSKTDDEAALLLSREIAGRIQRDLQYPGVIKVTVIREKRAIEYAR